MQQPLVLRQKDHHAFQLQQVPAAVGPGASIVVAATIFLAYLQSHYSTAFHFYWPLVQHGRDHGVEDTRGRDVRAPVLLIKQHFELMRLATTLGLVAMILLIATLISGTVTAVLPSAQALNVIGALTAVAGFALVIAAASIEQS